jgi:hypothetical protein
MLSTGAAINEFSIDGTMGGNSDLAVPTEKAVKTYVTSIAGTGFTGSGTTNYLPVFTSSPHFAIHYVTRQPIK